MARYNAFTRKKVVKWKLEQKKWCLVVFVYVLYKFTIVKVCWQQLHSTIRWFN